MDRFTDCNFDQQTIYEIYRACRLCGAGAGYKMPIIQNVVDLDGRDVELKQKIRECVKIEVSQDDKMPPLICELCVDKVNDFYEFLDMCRQTNRKTRHRLGLPLHTLSRGAADAGDCILGITEPVYVKDNLEESAPKNKSKAHKGKIKKESEPKSKVQVESEGSEERRSSRSSPALKRRTRNSVPSPPPPRDRRQTDTHQQIKKATAPLKSILKKEKEAKAEGDSPRPKRSREKDAQHEASTKRVKIAAKPPARAPPRPAPPAAPPAPPRAPRRQAAHSCDVCGAHFKSSQSLASHRRVHAPRAAKRALAKPQKNNVCPSKERQSPPSTQRDLKCEKCERVYITHKNFARHQRLCTFKEKAPAEAVAVAPAVLRSLRRVQIRVARCDALLASADSCRVNALHENYGLDRTCVYPYISAVRSLRIKSEPADSCDGMVVIGEEIRRQVEEGAFVHWDSEASEGEGEGGPQPLARLALRTIYSERCLGRAPRKRRRVKAEQFPDDAPGGAAAAQGSSEESSGRSVTDAGGLGPCDANADNSDSVQSEVNGAQCEESGAIVGDGVSSDAKSQESDMLKDIARDGVVDKEDELGSKSSFKLSEEDVRECGDGGQAEDEPSREVELNKDNDEGDELSNEVNGEIENGEELPQNTQEVEKDTTEREAVTICGDTVNEDNGVRNEDGDSDEVNSKTVDGEEMEKDSLSTDKDNDGEIKSDSAERQQFDGTDDNTNEEFGLGGVANGIADLGDEEGTGDNRQDSVHSTRLVPESTEPGIENEAVGSCDRVEYAEENRLGLNGGAEFSDEMDRKLMEELDAQIGECEGEGDGACDRDKITLADLLPDKAHERLDLDSIAEEFNFDP